MWLCDFAIMAWLVNVYAACLFIGWAMAGRFHSLATNIRVMAA